MPLLRYLVYDLLTHESTSNVPAATPIAEGIYAITSTGRESHLAYHITVPELGEVQKDLGLNEKGSYVLSVKNPTASGPANATLENGAEYPEHIMKKFRGLRWMPLEPELLDYVNTQFLIIGEGLGDTGRAREEQAKDKKDENKETPEEELERLDEEVSRTLRKWLSNHTNDYRIMTVFSISRAMMLSLQTWD